jgi:uncharacterized protein YcbX
VATISRIGTVARLWRFPVKSMAGEPLEQAALERQGIVGDRAYALIDAKTGKVVSAKNVQSFPGLLNFRAVFVEPPHPGSEPLPPVRITLPNGTVVTSGSGEVDRVLSAYFRRDVTLARAAPDDSTSDPKKPGSIFLAEAGVPAPAAVGKFMDLYPISVLTTSTLEKMRELRPESRFDERRFRMNVIVGTEGVRFLEDDCVGHDVAIGDSVRIRVALPDPRCSMTTLAQDGLPEDVEVLRTMTRSHSLAVGTLGSLPCAGVYASVEATGTMRVGDPVEITR